MSNYNNLVIHVIRAKDLQLKDKSQDVYVSLSTSGKSKWKSKVSTNTFRSDDGNCNWNEHCEFQMTDADTEIHVYVNYKTKFGTKETLGELIFDVAQMTRYQPPTWFRLTKKKDEIKERGQLQIEYQFANKFGSSVSNFSLNKIEKEKKFEKLKRKMNLIGRNKKAVMDNQSIVSVPLSRKSSFSSNASALAFSSPSPNHMARSVINETSTMLMSPANFTQSITPQQSIESTNNLTIINQQPDLVAFRHPSSTTNFLPTGQRRSAQNTNKVNSKNCVDSGIEFDSISLEPPKTITTKMRHRAEQLLHIRHKKTNGDQMIDSEQVSNYFGLRLKPNGEANNSRHSSIASSSGFASLGSNNLGALNENTSPEHLLTVIKHLRRELMTKDNKIRDLENYTDKLLSKIIVHYPDLLQVSNKTAFC